MTIRNYSVFLTTGLSLTAALLFSPIGIVRADEALQRIEQVLKDQGYYDGPVDGNPSDEFTKSVKRYQMYNGLQATGQIDAATLDALNKSIGVNAPTTGTPPPVVNTPTPAPASEGSSAPVPVVPSQPQAQPQPQAPSESMTVLQNGQAPSARLTRFFVGTPFEFAPPPVQKQLIQQGQDALLKRGFYSGQPDGQPSNRLLSALQRYQTVRKLKQTGIFDVQTMKSLEIMPQPPGAEKTSRKRLRPKHPRYPQPGEAVYPQQQGVYEGRISNGR